jgi:hypothetical protein
MARKYDDAITLAGLPRTYRQWFARIGQVGGEVRQLGERSFEVLAPRRWRNSVTGEITVKSQVMGRIGWYVRDGRNVLGGETADVLRAIENLEEGKDPVKPRRELGGNHTGRDHAGRFVADTRHAR